jgi:hypothetical protein
VELVGGTYIALDRSTPEPPGYAPFVSNVLMLVDIICRVLIATAKKPPAVSGKAGMIKQSGG